MTTPDYRIHDLLLYLNNFDPNYRIEIPADSRLEEIIYRDGDRVHLMAPPDYTILKAVKNELDRFHDRIRRKINDLEEADDADFGELRDTLHTGYCDIMDEFPAQLQ